MLEMISAVSKFPIPVSARREIEELTRHEVKFFSLFDRDSDDDLETSEVKRAGEELRRRLSAGWVLTMGNEAMLGLTGRSGVAKWRGRVLDAGDLRVVPTLSPYAVRRAPGLTEGWRADLRYVGRLARGEQPELRPPKVLVPRTSEHVDRMRWAIQEAEIVTYDVETTSGPAWTEFHPEAKMISLAVCTDDDTVWALPLYHRQSWYKDTWRDVVWGLGAAFATPGKYVAHNGKFDARWLRRQGVPAKVTFDTMLAAHLLDENVPKGLKAQARTRLGVAPWGVDTKSLLDLPLKDVLLYNALDAYYTRHLYHVLRAELIAQPRLLRIFKLLMMPASEVLTEAERRGVWVDRERLSTRHKIAKDELRIIEDKLTEWVPEDHPHRKVNFNPSNFSRWWLFEHLKLPVLAVGKSGAPSMNEEVMLELRAEHPAVAVMLERVKWQKYVSAFFSNYEVQLDVDDRVHTSFKLYGTVTGRLSSGKTDQEKLPSGAKNRGINLQQTPRDPFVRGLFGATGDDVFVEADFSQIELRLVAFASRDRTMMQLFQAGEDLHLATAMDVLGKRREEIDKEQRKKAKAVNFGFVYGMSASKFVQTAFLKYDLTVSPEEAAATRRAFFTKYDGLPRWHARQRRLVAKNLRVQSPLGRIRHLPDILSPDPKVRGEAERQAINAPIQSLGSDLTTLAMVELDRKFRRRQLRARIVGTVHDALLFEIHRDDLSVVLPLIRRTMENLPLRKKFGFDIDVPIKVDLKVGSHWGDLEEVS